MITKKDFEIFEKRGIPQGIYVDSDVLYVTERGGIYITRYAYIGMGSPPYVSLGYSVQPGGSTIYGIFGEEERGLNTYTPDFGGSLSGAVCINAMSFCKEHNLCVPGFTVSYPIKWAGNEIHFSKAFVAAKARSRKRNKSE